MSTFYNPDIMRFKLDGGDIFHEIDSSFNGATEFKEVATKDTGGTISTPANQTFGGSITAKPSADAAGTKKTTAALLALWKNKTRVAFEWQDGVTGNINFSGFCYISDFSMDSVVDDGSVGASYTIKGDGELIIGTTS